MLHFVHFVQDKSMKNTFRGHQTSLTSTSNNTASANHIKDCDNRFAQNLTFHKKKKIQFNFCLIIAGSKKCSISNSQVPEKSRVLVYVEDLQRDSHLLVSLTRKGYSVCSPFICLFVYST